MFMLSQQSSISFLFRDRKALVSIDSNCSRHMTGFYSLINTKPCSVLVDGAFESGEPSRATHQGDLQLGQLYFSNTAFVPGLRETILSLGQLDKEGCTTRISGGAIGSIFTIWAILIFCFSTCWALFSGFQPLLWSYNSTNRHSDDATRRILR